MLLTLLSFRSLRGGGSSSASGKGKRKVRRVEVDGQVFTVPERDLPTLLEALMLRRSPPRTASVEPVATARPEPAKAAPEALPAPEPVASVDEAQARYTQMLAVLQAQEQVGIAQMLHQVARRVMEELQDEEEAVIALLLG